MSILIYIMYITVYEGCLEIIETTTVTPIEKDFFTMGLHSLTEIFTCGMCMKFLFDYLILCSAKEYMSNDVFINWGTVSICYFYNLSIYLLWKPDSQSKTAFAIKICKIKKKIKNHVLVIMQCKNDISHQFNFPSFEFQKSIPRIAFELCHLYSFFLSLQISGHSIYIAN